MKSQEEIGWHYFITGRRMSKKWLKIGPNEKFADHPEAWATQITDTAIQVGISLWTQQNKFIHDNNDVVSKLEVMETEAMIHEELPPNIHPSHWWLSQLTKEARLQEPYSVQIA